MKGKILLAASLLGSCPALQAKELSFNVGAAETLGSQHYAGTSAYVKVKKDDYSLKPSYSQYHDDFSSGTYKTLAVRGAYDTKAFGLGATVGGTPKINGYSNVFFGVDGILSITPTGGKASKRIRGANQVENNARGSGLARIDLGAGLTHTTHRDDIGAAGRGRTNSVTLGQTDLSGSAGVEVLDNWLSLDVTKSVYDKDVAGLNARGSRVIVLPGLSSTIQGFPNTSASVRYEYEAFPIVVPYATYTHTTFLSGVGHSDSVKAGGYAEFDIVEVGGSYERYVQPGFPGRNFFSLSASARF
ncbi:MAG: hypothetical protein HY077_13060 [Elusimicrobia bacterium]|nr:hypothetical protein [Elusimicrobiota bacterium]